MTSSIVLFDLIAKIICVFSIDYSTYRVGALPTTVTTDILHPDKLSSSIQYLTPPRLATHASNISVASSTEERLFIAQLREHLHKLRSFDTNRNLLQNKILTAQPSRLKDPNDQIEALTGKSHSNSLEPQKHGIRWEPFPFSGVFSHLVSAGGSETTTATTLLPPEMILRSPLSTQAASALRGTRDSSVTAASTEGSPDEDLPFSVINPENFTASPDSGLVLPYQVSLGGQCFLQDREQKAEGLCLAADDCPPLLNAFNQFQYRHIRVFLLGNICRIEADRLYYCCPYQTFTALLPGNREAVVPLPPRSPYPAPLSPPGECGAIKTRPSRIIEGVTVQEGEWPWLVSIGFPVNSSYYVSLCSGSIITRRHVLTAAHCFRSNMLAQPTTVRLAEFDLVSNDGVPPRDYLIISRHSPLFYYYNAINDVTLLTLDRDIIYDDLVQPGCLPLSRPDAPQPGDNVTIVGYGLLLDDDELGQVVARYPHSIETRVHNNLVCQAAFYALNPIYVIDDRVFCEGGVLGQGSCKGDSGGPIHLWDENSQRYLIVGVVNAGRGCGVEDSPSVDLRVGAFIPWIRSVIGG